MHSKHHNIVLSEKKPHLTGALNVMARRPDHPIYASYTPEDLEKVNADPIESAIYYIVGDNQPVGSMRRSRLTFGENNEKNN